MSGAGHTIATFSPTGDSLLEGVLTFEHLHR